MTFTPSTALSPLRVAPGGHYFETTDGEPFLFIGPNDAINWPGLNGLFMSRNPEAASEYLQDLSRHGVTMIRLMLEYVQTDGRYFEKPCGAFNPRMVRLWDELFRLCERWGIRVLLAPWDNFWMARRWYRHPYFIENGGPAAGPADFFANEAVIQATIRRLTFVAERWGGSGAFGVWDLFNEIHTYWGGTAAQQHEVIGRISAAVREAEMRSWGFTRPQTVSIFGPDPPPEYEDLIFRHPSLDFATTHVYHKGPIDYPKDTVASAVTMGHWVRHARSRLTDTRPYLDTEHGPIDLHNNYRKSLPEPFDDEYERHMMWAHLASGGAGSGMRWPARKPHVLTAGMRRSLAGMASFCKLIDWRSFRPSDALPDLHIDRKRPRIHAFGVRDERQAVVWLLRDAPSRHTGTLPAADPINPLPLTLRGLAAGPYRIHFWNTKEGCGECVLLARSEGGKLEVSLPRFGNDLGMAVVPET